MHPFFTVKKNRYNLELITYIYRPLIEHVASGMESSLYRRREHLSRIKHPVGS